MSTAQNNRPAIQSILPLDILPCTVKLGDNWIRIHEFAAPTSDADAEAYILMDKWENGRWKSDPQTLSIHDEFLWELAALLLEVSLRKGDRVRMCLAFVQFLTQPSVPANDDHPESAGNLPQFGLTSSVGRALMGANNQQDQARSAWMREWLALLAPRNEEPQPPPYAAEPGENETVVTRNPDPPSR